jgi:chloramphenicol 3-O phosphotransferase
VLRWYTAMYRSIAVHSRLGFQVVVDVGHHEHYSSGLGVLAACSRELVGLPVLFVGLRCPVEVTLERRRVTWGRVVPRDPVELWHDAVHRPGRYDLEVDTSVLSPQECADRIGRRLRAEPAPDAFHRLRSLAVYGRANR